MRTGKLFIDGQDAYVKYGVYVVEGGYNQLVAYPPLKPPMTNDWHEEDGVETDLESPVLQAHEIEISFLIDGLKYADFAEMLSDKTKAYHVFNFAEIGRTYKLRMVSCPRQDDVWNFGIATIRFSEDNPMEGYTYQPPLADLPAIYDYAMDDVLLSSYGIRVLEGTREEIMRQPAVKKNLETSSQFSRGKRYDDSAVKYRSKDTKIHCLLRAKTLEELWRNYDAFLHDLIQPQERRLYVDGIVQEFPFYYKSCAVSQFYPIGEIWMEFTITICLTSDLRMEKGVILAAEDGTAIVTEEGDFFIDMEKQTAI